MYVLYILTIVLQKITGGGGGGGLCSVKSICNTVLHSCKLGYKLVFGYACKPISEVTQPWNTNGKWWVLLVLYSDMEPEASFNPQNILYQENIKADTKQSYFIYKIVIQNV